MDDGYEVFGAAKPLGQDTLHADSSFGESSYSGFGKPFGRPGVGESNA